jgi:hypothetical protein
MIFQSENETTTREDKLLAQNKEEQAAVRAFQSGFESEKRIDDQLIYVIDSQG